MTASTHTMLGTVQAIQYTGSNQSDVLSALASGWTFFTSPVTSTVYLYFIKNGQPAANSGPINPTDWIVTWPTYGTTQASLQTSGFTIISNTSFIQEYSA